ncbi:MAG: hypothetical protein H6809_06230 [Phycisphaeraceae bacterium]|nr:hypothetical protein [Phycisphaeraceae bacterium]
MPLHHRAEECLLAHLAAAGIAEGPLFRATIGGRITPRRIGRLAAWEMVKRRARDAGLPRETTSHTFRATGITVYLENGGTIENARHIAAHASIQHDAGVRPAGRAGDAGRDQSDPAMSTIANLHASGSPFIGTDLLRGLRKSVARRRCFEVDATLPHRGSRTRDRASRS